MEKLTLQQAQDYLKIVKSASQEDNEVAHQIEDECKNIFIYCLSKNLYTFDELKAIAIVVDEISDVHYCRWYA